MKWLRFIDQRALVETGDPKHSERLPMILSNDCIGFLRTDGDPKPQTTTSNAVDRPESWGLASAYYSGNLSLLQLYAIDLATVNLGLIWNI